MPLPIIAIPLIGTGVAAVIYGVRAIATGEDPSDELYEALLEQLPEKYRKYVTSKKTETELLIELADDAPDDLQATIKSNIKVLGEAKAQPFDGFTLIFHGTAESTQRHYCTIALKARKRTVGRIVVLNAKSDKKLPLDSISEATELITMHIRFCLLETLLERLDTKAKSKRIIFVSPDRASLEFLN